MAKQARSAVGQDVLTVLADRGYFRGEEIVECEQQGITTLVPKPLTSSSKAEGRFDKRDFIYIEDNDEYQCPAGQRAIRRFTAVEHGTRVHKYWSSACPKCPLKVRCTTSSYRRITRYEHEDVLERVRQRLDQIPEAMRVTQANRRASLRDTQSVDGLDSFSDTDADASQDRGKPACLNIQSEKSNADLRSAASDDGDRDISLRYFLR